MEKPVVLTDWDNTLRPGFTVLDWVEFLTAQGLCAGTVARALESLVDRYAAGHISYEHLATEVTVTYAAGLAGRPVAAVQAAALDFVSLDRPRLYPFAPILLRQMRKTPASIVVVSGCPVEILEAYRSELGFDEIFALRVEAQAGYYTARLSRNPAGADGKRAVVAEIVAASRTVALSIGDSSADLPLLEAARHRIVVDNPELLMAEPRVLRLRPDTDQSDLGDALRFVEHALAPS